MTQLSTKLASAVDEIFNLIDHGESATDAIVKTSSAYSLLPDQVTALCRLYNRSSSISQRAIDGPLEQKLGAVAIVDPRVVIRKMSERQRSKAAMFSADSAANIVLDAEDRWNQPATPKMASMKVRVAPPAEKTIDKHAGLHHGLSGTALNDVMDDLNRKVASLIAEGELLLKQADTAVGVATQTLIKSATANKMDVTRLKQAEFALRNESEDAREVFSSLQQLVEPYLPQHKRASLHAEPEVPQKYLPGVVDATGIVPAIKRATAAVSTVRTRLPELAGKIAALREEAHIIRSNLQGFTVENRDLYLGKGTLKEAQLEHINKVASTASSLFGYMVGKSKMAPKTPTVAQTPAEKFRLRLQHPQHEANLAAVRSRRTLQELLVDDPILSGMPEEQVISAFNELSAYSPQVTEHPAALRAILRQYMQNNSSSFDLSQIRNLERSANRYA